MAAVENAFAPEGSNSSAHIQDVVEDSSRSSDPDPVKLAAKYKAEREKRNNLRPSGLGQYQKITGNAKYANYLDDPYADPNASEIKPVTKKVQVCILGGGFGGLQIAGRLSEAGFKDVLIVEKASDFGGTWYGFCHDASTFNRVLTSRTPQVLEPLSRRPVRHRILYLYAPVGGAKLHSQGEVLVPTRALSACQEHR